MKWLIQVVLQKHYILINKVRVWKKTCSRPSFGTKKHWKEWKFNKIKQDCRPIKVDEKSRWCHSSMYNPRLPAIMKIFINFIFQGNRSIRSVGGIHHFPFIVLRENEYCSFDIVLFPDTIVPYKVDVFEKDLYVTTTNHSIYVMNKFGRDASKVMTLLVSSRGKISDLIIVQQNKQKDFANGAYGLWCSCGFIPPSSFSLYMVGASSFHSPHSLVLCFFSLYPFLLQVFSYNVAPHQFWSSYVSVSTHFHLPITASSSVFLSTRPNSLSLASLIFSLGEARLRWLLALP